MKIASVRRKLQSTELSVQIEHMERVNRTHTNTVTLRQMHTYSHTHIHTHSHSHSHIQRQQLDAHGL